MVREPTLIQNEPGRGARRAAFGWAWAWPKEPIAVFLALALTLFGLLMSFDAAYPRTLAAGRGIFPAEFRSQLLVLLLAPIAYFGCARLSVRWLRMAGVVLWALVSALLVAAVASPLKFAMNGAERWVKLGPIVVQPAEFAKLAVILFLAAVYARRPSKPASDPEAPARGKRRNWAGRLDHELLPALGQALPAVWVLVALVLIDKEPDLGTAAVVGATASAIFWLGGVSGRTLAIGAAVLAVGAYVMVRTEPYRYERLVNHARRWEPENIEGSGYQSVQSEFALASGRFLGEGIGQGRAKHVLPAATTDFVMATVGEEFGFLGSVTILGLLGFLVVRLAYRAGRAIDRNDGYPALVLGGVATWIGVQGCVNLLQANGTLPPIGIPFPFVSSGGSSLLALWAAMGVCEAVLRAGHGAPRGGASGGGEKEEPIEGRGNGRRHGRPYLSRA
jgi:cell division protein FtsW